MRQSLSSASPDVRTDHDEHRRAGPQKRCLLVERICPLGKQKAARMLKRHAYRPNRRSRSAADGQGMAVQALSASRRQDHAASAAGGSAKWDHRRAESVRPDAALPVGDGKQDPGGMRMELRTYGKRRAGRNGRLVQADSARATSNPI
jgi:hypothetical protein